VKKTTRRQFLGLMGTIAGVTLLGPACSAGPAGPAQSSPARRTPATPVAGQAYLAVAHGADADAVTRAAVAGLGGIGRFVRTGDDVIIKPNICHDYHPPEYATTTNPAVVAALVTMCRDAGARRVRVMDMPFGGTTETAYAISGIADAVQAVGGEMEVMSPVKFALTAIPSGKDITEWEVYQEVLKADVLINVPIAKHHSLARLSLGAKNLLGVVRNANQIHRNLGQRVTDLASLIRPTLTVVDGMRILVANGPTGGSLNDVRQTDTVIASHDMVAADAYAATLFGMEGAEIPYVKLSADMGLGVLDLSAITIEETNA
jgi:uncharacterized protein (DUF362 family)